METNKSEEEEVFYSAVSSAVSDTTLSAGSEPPQSPTPSIPDTLVPSSPISGAKSKGLSRLKQKTKKLIPKRFKSQHQVAPADFSGSETTPETVKPLLDKKGKKLSVSDDEDGVKSDKEKKKKSRAGNIVRRLTFGKRSKVTPVSTEDDPTTSSSTTPSSTKRQTPEGATLSISEQSLVEIEDPQGDGGETATLKKSVTTTLQATGIDDSSNKKKKKFNKVSGVELHSTSTVAAAAAAIAAATIASSNTTIKTNNKKDKKLKIDQKHQQLRQQLPTPPPTPPYTHIPLKIIEGGKPISAKPNAGAIGTLAGQVTAADQIAIMADSDNKKQTKSGGGATPKLVTGSSSTPQSSAGKQRDNIVQEHNQPTPTKIESIKKKFFKNITASYSDISPPSRAPAVPYNISELEIASILDRKQSSTNKLFAQLPKELPDPPLASSEEASLNIDYETQIKLDREQTVKIVKTGQVFATSESQEFMKRSEGDRKNIDSKKKAKQSSDTSPTVHVQEAKQPYQVTSSSQDKETPFSSLTSDTPKEPINFRIGTPVRPVKTLQPITHITDISIESNPSETSGQQKEEASSFSSDSQSPPNSESSRRRIKYIPQSSEVGPEDEGLLEPGSFGQPSSFISDSYSIDYSLNPLSMAGNAEVDGQGVSFRHEKYYKKNLVVIVPSK